MDRAALWVFGVLFLCLLARIFRLFGELYQFVFSFFGGRQLRGEAVPARGLIKVFLRLPVVFHAVHPLAGFGGIEGVLGAAVGGRVLLFGFDEKTARARRGV